MEREGTQKDGVQRNYVGEARREEGKKRSGRKMEIGYRVEGRSERREAV
jgi:hypothetical protein